MPSAAVPVRRAARYDKSGLAYHEPFSEHFSVTVSKAQRRSRRQIVYGWTFRENHRQMLKSKQHGQATAAAYAPLSYRFSPGNRHVDKCGDSLYAQEPNN
jgi:hypothetical protein